MLLISCARTLGRDCRRAVIVRANKFVVSGRLKHLLNIDPASRENEVNITRSALLSPPPPSPVTQLLNFVNFAAALTIANELARAINGNVRRARKQYLDFARSRDVRVSISLSCAVDDLTRI